LDLAGLYWKNKVPEATKFADLAKVELVFSGYLGDRRLSALPNFYELLMQ
jgi:hypothetical protein